MNFNGQIALMPRVFNVFGRRHYVQGIANGGERRVYDVSFTGGSHTLAFRAYQGMSDLTFSANGTRSAYVGEDPRHPQDVWVTENGFTIKRQLTHLNPQIAALALGDARSVSWIAKNGIHLDGTLLLPANYQPGKRYPMITWIYGGEPQGTWGRALFGVSNGSGTEEFSPIDPFANLQLLASRGYAVFVPDTVLHVGTPMRDLADEVLPGIDTIVAMGIADPNHLGLYGVSYGGYSTLALLVQSDRFTAAVAMMGVYDLVTPYGMLFDSGGDFSFWAETGQGRMGGTPWTQRQRYIDNSPFFFLDKVHAAVLLEFGTEDPLGNDSEKAFVGLRRLDKTVELVRYAGEPHGILKRSNQVDFLNRMFAWLHTYL
jgi:dipeptidyl aminopeptidase/acylaminoacyl peptidase